MEIIEHIKEILLGKVKILERTVKKHGTSGAVYISKDYVGKNVSVLIIEPSQEKTVTT